MAVFQYSPDGILVALAVQQRHSPVDLVQTHYSTQQGSGRKPALVEDPGRFVYRLRGPTRSAVNGQ